MKVLFDTSVIIAAIIESHPFHAKALPWLIKSKAQTIEAIVASHTLAELYSVLTSLPVKPRVSSAAAQQLIHDNVISVATVVTLTASEYMLVIKQLAMQELIGGVVYDALIAQVAIKAKAQKILTLNVKDFKRVYPESDIISLP